ncbi:MAG TPA: hypothetical protein VF017_00005 [Thermoanaerobaculia bacterium]|nr:hypothetical protein [Thermoanaerobaculia bacterium]
MPDRPKSTPREFEELAPFRESFLTLFTEPEGAAAFRRVGHLIFEWLLDWQHAAPIREPLMILELRARAADLRYVERFLLDTVAVGTGIGIDPQWERALKHHTGRWALRAGTLAAEIETAISDAGMLL